ncbi:DUF1844 domain-containing protein [Desulfocurvus sp. DL9XJH121]
MPEEHEKECPEGAAETLGCTLPQVTFSTFVMSLASSALVQLGEVPEPETGAVGVNLPVAKHTIDILSMLKEKTAKGLDADEAKLLEGLLYELRMKYVMKKK